jgi:hypothetical protein
MGRACSTNGAKRILEGKLQGKRQKRRCADNTKMDLTAIELGGMDWINLAQDRDQWRTLVNTVMNLQIP